jgi:2-polyprenyl-3-methyl-5-hydroxy-6-metoxy-1,4-benzoquinol methylase
VRPWMAALGVDAPAHVLDVGCGAGVAAVELAKRFPAAQVEGIDLDEASIDLARAGARAAGVDVRFRVRDAADPGLDGAYDLITLFDSLHHLARPVETLRRLRALLAPGGTLLVAEHRADGVFERFTHLISVIHCLPTAMAEQPSAGLGAVMTPEKVAALGAAAGFTDIHVAPIQHDLLRFFVLS